MRLKNAIKADLNFQFKQGFYVVYLIITLLYLAVISQLPADYKSIAVPLIVYGDPSLLGFFFIGGIVMLEKTQGVLDYLVVTPLKSKEYLLSKVISLSILSVLAGLCITISSYRGSVNFMILLMGILLTSMFFTLYGFLVAAHATTINDYFLNMIPYMLVIVLPCFSLLFDSKYLWLFNIFPSVAALNLVFGAFDNMPFYESFIYISYLILLNFFMLGIVEKIFNQKIVYKGEGAV